MSFQLPFLKKEKIAKDTWSFYFLRTKEYPDFLPGQYDDMTLVTDTGKQISQSFTLSSSPLEKRYIQITTKIKESPSQFKRILFSLTPGQVVNFFGPIGGFYLREEDLTPRVFLAGGIGITPFYSMITYAEKNKLQIPMILLVSFSTKEDFIFYPMLSKIKKRNTYIQIIYTTKRISEEIIKAYVEDLRKPIYMVAGSPVMVENTIQLLQNMRVPEERIKAEEFTGY